MFGMHGQTSRIATADAGTGGKTVEAAGLTTIQKVGVHDTKVGGDKFTLIGN
jgi:hypothetical protein